MQISQSQQHVSQFAFAFVEQRCNCNSTVQYPLKLEAEKSTVYDCMIAPYHTHCAYGYGPVLCTRTVLYGTSRVQRRQPHDGACGCGASKTAAHRLIGWPPYVSGPYSCSVRRRTAQIVKLHTPRRGDANDAKRTQRSMRRWRWKFQLERALEVPAWKAVCHHLIMQTANNPSERPL